MHLFKKVNMIQYFNGHRNFIVSKVFYYIIYMSKKIWLGLDNYLINYLQTILLSRLLLILFINYIISQNSNFFILQNYIFNFKYYANDVAHYNEQI